MFDITRQKLHNNHWEGTSRPVLKERVFLLAVLWKADAWECPHRRGKTDTMVEITAEKAALPALSMSVYTMKSQKQGRLMSQMSIKSLRRCVCKKVSLKLLSRKRRGGEWTLSLMSLMFASQRLTPPKSFNLITLMHLSILLRIWLYLLKHLPFFCTSLHLKKKKLSLACNVTEW